MRLHLICVGRARGTPEGALVETYRERLPWPLAVVEVEERRLTDPLRRQESENARLLEVVPRGAALWALDRRGRSLDSEAFAARLAVQRDGGTADLALLIGGADGLTAATRARADLLLSFGPMTFPHLLARAMLAEQLYRATAILAGHPYHRAG